MTIKHELITKIKDYFDLNIYETKVWLALLSKGIASAGEVAAISGVPRSRAYDVLEGLEKRGFAIAKIGKPVKYIGVKPRVVIEKMKNNVKKDAEEKIVMLSKIKETDEFNELNNLYNESINPVKREDISASIKGKSNISNYIKEILENAQKEVIICINAEDFRMKMSYFKQTFKQLSDSNVKIKLALNGDERLITQISKSMNMKIKQIDIKAKFFIVDKKEIIFYLNNEENSEDIAIWLNSEFFAQSFSSLFDLATK